MTNPVLRHPLALSLCGIWHNLDFSFELCSLSILRRRCQFISFLLDHSFSVSFNEIPSSSCLQGEPSSIFLYLIFSFSLSLSPSLFPLSLSLSIRPWQVVCHSSASYFSQQSLTQRNLREFIHTHTHTHNMDQKTRLYMICITYNLRKCISSHKLNNLTCENDLQILSPHLTFSQYLCLIFQCLLDFTI